MSKNTQLGNLVNGVYVDSSGKVGIGTEVPSTQLQINGTPSTDWGNLTLFDPRTQAANQGGMLAFAGYKTGTSAAAIFAQIKGNKENGTSANEAGYLSFLTNNNTTYVERMRITSGGNVQIKNSTADTAIEIFYNGTTSTGAMLADANNFVIGGQTGKGLVLCTNNLGQEKMRITASGGVYIGLTSSGTNKFAVSAGGTTSDLYVNSSGGIGSYSFGTGIVYANGGILTMTNPSDKRLKKDIKEISYGLSDILKLQPVTYNWINDSANQGLQFGFIAQDVQSVMPDAVKEFGEEKYLGLEKDAIYATLVKAIQELSAEINILKQK